MLAAAVCTLQTASQRTHGLVPLVHVQVVLCSACSGHGFKMSSVIGEQLARMVLGSGSEDGLTEAMAMHRLDASRPGHAELLAEFHGAR
jgi:hypothetical protein